MSAQTRARPHRRRAVRARGIRIFCCALALVVWASARLVAQDSPASARSEMLTAAVASAPLPQGSGELVVTRVVLSRLYELADARPIWLSQGRPTAQARRRVEKLAAVDLRGLAPATYGVDSLARRLEAFTARPGDELADGARFDVALSLAAMRALAHLHAGRVDPRARAADSSLRAPQMRRKVVRPGDRYDDAPVLRRLLEALGDLTTLGGSMPPPSCRRPFEAPPRAQPRRRSRRARVAVPS